MQKRRKIKTVLPASNDAKQGVDVDNEVMPRHFFLYLVGKPGSGKSVLLHNLIQNEALYYKKFDFVFVVCPTYKELGLKLPKSNFTDTFSLDWIYKNISKAAAIAKKKGKKMNVLLVMDDVISDIVENKTEARLTTLIFNRRHIADEESKKDKKKIKHLLTLSIIVTSQKYIMLPPNIRSSLSWLIFFNQNINDLKTIHDEVTNGIELKDWLKLVSNAFSEDFQFVQIRMDKQSRISVGW